MDWQVQSVVIVTELAAGFILFRFFIPFFRRIKTGRFDLYIGDRFKKDGSEPKFAGVVMLITSVLGLTAGLSARTSRTYRRYRGQTSFLFTQRAAQSY